MKGLFVVIVALFVTVSAYSQTYKYGAMFSGIIVKAEGKIVVSESDSLVSLTAINNGVENTDTYKFVKKTNRVIYFTDGVKTHSFIINKENGKKKGFEHDTVIILTFEGQPITVTYYCVEQ